MLLTEKNNPEKTVKGRLVYDGSKTRDWVSCKDTASPTVAMESIALTTVIVGGLMYLKILIHDTKISSQDLFTKDM